MMNVVIAGDFSPMNRVNKFLQKSELQRFEIKGGGMIVLNFESTIAKDGCEKISKVGPHLRCCENTASYLKDCGVTAVTLANNHTMDYGKEGLMHTIHLLHEKGISTVGAGNDADEAKKTLYLKQAEETLAIINCCEHEFSYAEGNHSGTNPLNPIEQFYSIREAKINADYVIVIVHGGHEFYNLPSPRMVETYRFFIDAGADAVVNHHQHCYSGFEYYHDKPIYYGLGNFYFDWPGKKPSFYTGYCVRLHLADVITSEELPYTQCLNDPIVKFGEPDGFREDLMKLNSIIQDPERLIIETDKYFKSLERDCVGVMTPFGNPYLNALVRRGYIPAMISKGKKLLWKAYLDCEAHRDVILNYLKQKPI